VKIEKFFGGANHKQTKEEAKLGVSNEELIYGRGGKKPIIVTDVPEEAIAEIKASQTSQTSIPSEPSVLNQEGKEAAQ
jgi:NADH-quinone oxidoreductase subunit B